MNKTQHNIGTIYMPAVAGGTGPACNLPGGQLESDIPAAAFGLSLTHLDLGTEALGMSLSPAVHPTGLPVLPVVHQPHIRNPFSGHSGDCAGTTGKLSSKSSLTTLARKGAKC